MTVDIRTIQTWLTEIAERIESNSAQVERLRAEIASDKRREAALRALLAAETEVSQDARPAPSDSSLILTQTPDVRRHPIECAAVEVLKGHGKPIHISDLRAEIIARGIPIPGKGMDANVIVHLARSPDICRVGRGLYALREWGVPEVPARRRRSIRKKGRAKSRS